MMLEQAKAMFELAKQEVPSVQYGKEHKDSLSKYPELRERMHGIPAIGIHIHTPVEQLAVEIDRFVYAYDTDLYRGSIQNMTEGVAEITEALKQRDTHDIALWLADIATDGTVPEERKRAL